jgi:UDP-glucose 4-epimerase
MNDRVMIVGGGGFVGAHIAKALHKNCLKPVVFDNFSNGHRAFVKWGTFIEGDIRNKTQIAQAVAHIAPSAIIHCAAFIEVGESVRNPTAFYENNVGGAINVATAALEAGVKDLVFSSTAAVYGEPRYSPLDEDHPQEPINPYGRSKLIVDQILADLSRHTELRSVSLRYFNAAGADHDGEIGEHHVPETHALPLAINTALGRRASFTIFGDDFDTPDGTALRDYIHVEDLAEAHIRALQYMRRTQSSGVFNLGGGKGTSVAELVSAVRSHTGADFPVIKGPRRAGDALGWQPSRSFDQIVRSAIAWHRDVEPKLFPDTSPQ